VSAKSSIRSKTDRHSRDCPSHDQESESGTTVAWVRSVMVGQDSSDNAFITGNTESQTNLPGDSRAAPRGIALLDVDNGPHAFSGPSFGAWAFARVLRREGRTFAFWVFGGDSIGSRVSVRLLNRSGGTNRSTILRRNDRISGDSVPADGKDSGLGVDV